MREVSVDQDFAAEEDMLLALSSRIWRSNPEELYKASELGIPNL